MSAVQVTAPRRPSHLLSIGQQFTTHHSVISEHFSTFRLEWKLWTDAYPVKFGQIRKCQAGASNTCTCTHASISHGLCLLWAKGDDHLVGILHIICDDGWIVRNGTAHFHHGDLPKIPFTTCYNNIIPPFVPINGGSRS